MPELKNQRHERFCHATAKGMNRSEAYYAAGFTAGHARIAGQRGSRLMARPDIRARVEELTSESRDEALQKASVSKERVVQGLLEVIQKATQAKEIVDRKGNPTGTYKEDLGAANRAYELLGKELGMFKERHVFEGLDDELDGMDAEQLRTFVRGAAQEVGLRVVEMNDDQKREWIECWAPRLGLRVVAESRQDPDGAQVSEAGGIQAVPEAGGVPPTRIH